MATLPDPTLFFSTLGDKLEPSLKSHLKNVYASLSLSLISASVGGYIHLFTDLLKHNTWITLLSLGFLILLFLTQDNGKNGHLRLLYLQGFAFTTGLSLGPLLDMVIQIDPTIVPSAFIGTAVIFVCFSLSAMFSNQRQWLYLGGTLTSAMTMLLLLSLMNIFIGSQILFQVHIYLGFAVMCGFILYDTQLIIEKRRRGDQDFIWHSIELFIDFIQVFRYLLVILSQKEQKKKNK